jgi:hypothetical protein
VEPSLVQGAIDTVVRPARQPIPEGPDELEALIERERAAPIKAAQHKHGGNYRAAMWVMRGRSV